MLQEKIYFFTIYIFLDVPVDLYIKFQNIVIA